MSEAKEFEVTRLDAGSGKRKLENRQLIGEEPVVIQVANGPSWSLSRTPGGDEELATGLLLSEGIAATVADVRSISQSPGKIIVSLTRIGKPDGIVPKVESDAAFPRSIFGALPENVRARQKLFRKTGASHGAAIFGPDGKISALAEDLSRHCALDKAIGLAAREGADFGGLGLFVTGRVSAGMVAKAARVGIPLIAAVSAASAAAVESAAKCRMTLAGFVRGDGITIYACPERIQG